MPPLPVLVALADPTRCRIVEILREGPQPVHVISGAFSISRPAISRHLRVLKQAHLISEKKLGRENRYALHPEKLKPVGQWLAEMQAPRKSRATAKPRPTVDEAPKAIQAPVRPAGTPRPRAALEPAASAILETKSVPPAAKPKRETPVSQMGFDF